MFAPNSGAQMEPEATLPTDPIQAETCFETFTPFFTTPDADASTSGAWRAFVHPDASPDFEVGATKEIGFTIAATHMVSWPNSFLQFSMKLDLDKTSRTWLGRMRGMGVKFMPDLKMIFDKIDLLINESPFQVITEFPRVNFIRSNILGGSKEWIRMVQGGSYIVSPDLKTNSLEMGGGQISQKVVSQPTFPANTEFGKDYVQSATAFNSPVAATMESMTDVGCTFSAAKEVSRFGNPLESFGQIPFDPSSCLTDNSSADLCNFNRHETANASSIVFAPSEDMDFLDVLERGDEVVIQIPFRDLFSSLASIQWMPGALFRRINMRFHIRSDPEAYLLGYMMSSLASTGTPSMAAVKTTGVSVTGHKVCHFTPARAKIEEIKFKFTNARCVLFGQQFSPNLMMEFNSYLQSKSDLQACWYQAYMYYRVIRVLANASNNIDQNFTTISPGSAWLLSDPWYEERDSYKQKQRILIPTVVNSMQESLTLKGSVGEENENGLQKGNSLTRGIRTFSSFIPYAPIANKVIQRSYIAINGSEFPPTYEEQHWRLLTQNNTVHGTLGFDIHNNIKAYGDFNVGSTCSYIPQYLQGSVYGTTAFSNKLIGDVYYPPYFEKKTWRDFDDLILYNADADATTSVSLIGDALAGDFYAGTMQTKCKHRLALDRNLFYSDITGKILAKKVRLEENYLRYLMSTGFHIDPFQSQSTLIGFEQWNTMWPIIAFPIGSQDSATGAPLYEASAMTGRLHLDKEQENQGISLPFYLVIQEAYLTAICADGSLVTMIGTA